MRDLKGYEQALFLSANCEERRKTEWGEQKHAYMHVFAR